MPSFPVARLLPPFSTTPPPPLGVGGDASKIAQKKWESWVAQQDNPAAWHAWRFALTLEHLTSIPGTHLTKSGDAFSASLLVPFYKSWFAQCKEQPAMLQRMAEAVLESAWYPIPHQLPSNLATHLLMTLGEYGADPKTPDHQGRTWMHWARDPSLQRFLLPVLNADVIDAEGKTLGHRLVEDLKAAEQGVKHGGGTPAREHLIATWNGLRAWLQASPSRGHAPDHEGWTPLHRLAQIQGFHNADDVKIPERFFWPGTDPQGYTALRRRLHWSLQAMFGSATLATSMKSGSDIDWMAQHLQQLPAEAAMQGPDGVTAWEWILSQAKDMMKFSIRSDIQDALVSWLLPLESWVVHTGLEVGNARWFKTTDLSLFLIKMDQQQPSDLPAPQGDALAVLAELSPHAAATVHQQMLAAAVPPSSAEPRPPRGRM